MKTKEKDQKRNLKGVLIGLFLISTILIGAYAIKLNHDNEVIIQKALQEKAEMTLKHRNSFLEIENNLRELTAHEEVLRNSVMTQENFMTDEQRVQQEILVIEALIDKNERIIAELKTQLADNDEQLDKYSSKNRRLERKLKKFVDRTNELENLNLQLAADLEKSQQQVDGLQEDLLNSELANEALGNEIVVRDQIIYAQEEDIAAINSSYSASYFIVGEYKELRDLDVVEKEGGLAGIGAVKTLKDDFDAEPFTEIDRRNYKTIPVFAKKAELATTHPTGSYEWIENEDGIQWLKIKDPATFWNSSKYLVILTDKALDKNEMI